MRPSRALLLLPVALGLGCLDFTSAYDDCVTRGVCKNPPDGGGIGGPTTVVGGAVPSGYANLAYSHGLAATGGDGTYTWQVTAGSLPPGMSLTSDGTLTGTTTSTGTFSFTATAASAGTSASGDYTIVILPELLITTAALNDGYLGQNYSQTIAASGGLSPYTYAFQGTQPAGLSMSSLGAITGQPNGFPGPNSVTVAVRDANATVIAKQMTLTVYQMPQLSPSNPADAYTTVAYSATLSVSEGKPPYTFAVTSGTLPAGLTLAAATGAVSGTPTVTGTPSFTVSVTDVNGKTDSKILTLGVYAPLSITSPMALPDAYSSNNYSFSVQKTGGKAPIQWSVTTGLLPPGITLTPSGITGQLTGQASGPGLNSFTITATDANLQSAFKMFTLDAYDPPVVSSTTLADGTINTAYSEQLVATGGKPPLTWEMGTGALPGGLQLIQATGVVTGTPNAAGPANFTVTVRDNNNRTQTVPITFSIYTSLTITTSPTLTTAYSGGIPYSINLAAAGGKTPYTWTLVSGTLPAPFTLLPNGTFGPPVGSTPGAPGNTTFRVRVTDQNLNFVEKNLTLIIVPPPSISTTVLDDGYRQQGYSITIQVQDGKPPYTFAKVAGTWPNGITLDANTGQISGTPTGSATTTTPTVQVTDDNTLTVQQAYTLSVYDMPNIVTTALNDGYVNDPFSQNLVATGGKPPLNWGIQSGQFPAPLSLSGSGTVSGTPTAVQNQTVSVLLTDANGKTASHNVTMQTYLPASIATTLPDGYAGVAYPSTQLTATGGKPNYSFSMFSGAPPPNITFTAATATFAGTPQTAGTTNFTVRVQDNNAHVTDTAMAIQVFDLPVVSTIAMADAYAGSPYNFALVVAGGKPSFSWRVIGGTVPLGLTLNSNGTFTGTTSAVGPASITVEVTDANNKVASRTVPLQVLPALQITTSSVDDGYIALTYSTPALVATGGKAPYTFSLVGGSLPGTVALSGGGALTGTPAGSTGGYPFTVRVTDANNVFVDRAFTLTTYLQPSVSTPPTLTDAYKDSSYSATISGTNGKPPYTFATADALPAGLTLNAGGTITGTAGSTGTYDFTVVITDSHSQTGQQLMHLTSRAPLAVSTPSPLPDGYPNTAYSVTLAGTGGLGPYTFSLTSGALPSGYTLAASGLLSGSTTAVGSFSVSVTVTDSNLHVGIKTLTLEVLNPPQITTATLPYGYAGSAYSAPNLAATLGRAPYTFFAPAVDLPNGISLSDAGVFSGTPQNQGTSPFVATVKDFNNVQTTSPLQIIVLPALAVTGLPLVDGYVDDPYNDSVGGDGGLGPYAFSVANGATPNGVGLSGAGVFTGTPTAAGTATFGIGITDSNNGTRSTSATIDVYAKPLITTASLAQGVSGTAYLQTVATSGGKPPFNWNQTGTLPPGMAFDGGTFFGTPGGPTPLTYSNIQVTVADTNNRQNQKTFSMDVVNTLTITTVSIDDAYVDAGFPPQTVTAAGGGGSYTFLVDGGALPVGLTLAGSGLLTGTPQGPPGTATFVVQVSDGTNIAYKGFTQDVFALPSITTTSLQDAYTDQPYGQTLTRTGGKSPYTWNIPSGLPDGIIHANGSLSGQATATGQSNFTVQLVDAHGMTDSKGLSITAYNPPIQTSSTTIQAGYLTAGYLPPFQLQADGGKPGYTWATDGGMPLGLTLSPAGAISGTPTGALGSFTFSTGASDQNSRVAVAPHTITIFGLPIITTAALPDAYRQVPYTATLVTDGGAGGFTWDAGSTLPPGLILNPSSGAITGTAADSGTFAANISATDVNGKVASKAFSLVVQPPLQVTTASPLQDGYVNQSYSQPLTATGGKPPYTWDSTGTLPPGLLVALDGGINGPPTTAGGPSSFVVRVTDTNNTVATKSVDVTVYTMPLILTSLLPDAYRNDPVPYALTLTGTGGKPGYTFMVDALPAGLTLDGGYIGGTATAGAANQLVTITMKDVNLKQDTKPLLLSVYNLPSISAVPPADGYAGQPYSQQLQVDGGRPGFTWSAPSGGLPPGLTLNSAGTVQPSITAGSVTNGQQFTFNVSVQDFNNKSANQQVTLTTYLMPSVGNLSLTTATEGVTYMKLPAVFEAISGINGKLPPNYQSYNATGLPSGLSLVGREIHGIPAQGSAGTYSVGLSLVDQNSKPSPVVTLPLQVVPATPIFGGGASGVAPVGSPITDELTVFAVDDFNVGLPGLGVRVRKNGVEYLPVKELLTDVSGKAHFTGLGLDGGTDTVDVTVNGANFRTTTFAQVNASLITMEGSMEQFEWNVGASTVFDTTANRLIATSGRSNAESASAFHQNQVCATDVRRLSTAYPTMAWTTDVQPGMVSSPPGRSEAPMASRDGASYLFGGTDCNGMALGDLWKLNLAGGGGGTWTAMNPPGVRPSPRSEARMERSPGGAPADGVVMFGGRMADGSATKEMWRFDPVAGGGVGLWQNMSVPTGVTPRYGMGSAYSSALGKVWMCGGYAETPPPFPFMDFTSQCYSVDAAGNWLTQLPIPDMPPGAMGPRAYPAMAADPAGNIWLFGGRTSAGPSAQLFMFNGLTWQQIFGSGWPMPGPREKASLYWDAAGKLVLVGGSTENSQWGYSEVFVFDPATYEWTRTGGGDPISPGFMISGTLSGTPGLSGDVTIRASGTSGWEGDSSSRLESGGGNYSLSGIPPGETIALNAYVRQYGTPTPLPTGIDLGVLGPINANTTQNINFPDTPQVNFLNFNGTVTYPGWSFGQFFVEPSQSRPNYPAPRNSNGMSSTTGPASWQMTTIAPLAPGQQDAMVAGQNVGAALIGCEVTGHVLYAMAPGNVGNVTLAQPPRTLSPGIKECTPRGGSANQLAPLRLAQTGAGPVAVAVGDVNGDTIPDGVVASNLFFGQLSVYYGQGNGTFQQQYLSLTTSNTPISVALAAVVGGDAYPDIIVLEQAGANGQVEVFQNDGQGQLLTSSSYSIPANPVAVAVADLNNDGYPEVISTHDSPTTLSVLPGLASGGFGAWVAVNVCGVGGGRGLAVTQLNGDAFRDIAVACGGGSGDVRILPGDGSFNPATTTYPLTVPPPGFQGPYALIAADIAGDGKPDLVATNTFPGGSAVTVWTNNSAGTTFNFAMGAGYGSANNPQSLAAADVDSDGDTDVLVADTLGDKLLVLGNTSGTLSTLQVLPAPQRPGWVTAADLNGDGRSDAVVLGNTNSQIEVFMQTRPLPATSEGAYSFTFPAGPGAVQLIRGAELQKQNWVYLAPLPVPPAAFMSITLPLASTLAPVAPTPTGQVVGWTAQMYRGTFDINNVRFRLVRPTDQVAAGASLYVRQ